MTRVLRRKMFLFKKSNNYKSKEEFKLKTAFATKDFANEITRKLDIHDIVVIKY